jgi:murein L,D-transpeptidase YcbB/YkuD
MRTAIDVRAGRFSRSARHCLFGGGIIAALALAVTPIDAQAASNNVDGQAASYAMRAGDPLWVHDGLLGPEADRLLELVATADLDGLNPKDYKPRSLASAIRKANDGSPKALAKAEALLSKTLAAYVRDVRRPRDVGMLYVDKALAPSALTTSEVLRAAASAPSLQQYLKDIGWMHPIYGQLRNALTSGVADSAQAQVLRANLERARALPADSAGRYILVDAGAARLYMYENGRVRDTMRVIVGKPTEPTPMMAGLIRYAMVNPYWNIPPDLVQNRVAPNVISGGLTYLKTKRYQVLSDWSEEPSVLDPAKVNWQAVAAGSTELAVRQMPGKDNAMGKMKFMFPNELGVYLHDTPDKDLFLNEERRFSSGCVRLEHAAALYQWLFDGALPPPDPHRPELRVPLPKPVPVYILDLPTLARHVPQATPPRGHDVIA